MATYYFRNAGNLWGTATNWSLTSGGGATGAVPTSTDDVIFDSNSGSLCQLITNRDCRNISFTNWTGTFAMLNVLHRVYGSIDFGSGLFTITGSATWQMGATVGIGSGQTIKSNGKTMIGSLSIGYTSLSTTMGVILLDNLTVSGNLIIESNKGSTTLPLLSGSTLYVAGGIQTTATGRNLYSETPIKLIGTGSISTFNSNAVIAGNIEIITSGTITFSSTVYCSAASNPLVLSHTSGTVISAGSSLYLMANTTLNTSAVTWNYIYASNTVTHQPLVTNNLNILSSANFTNDFTTANLYMGTGQLGLSTGKTYSVTNNMASSVSTLAARASIVSLTSGVKAIFNLSPSATQDNGYLSATDIDSNGGRSIWTYKGILTRTLNWNQLSTNPKKHVLKSRNRILK